MKFTSQACTTKEQSERLLALGLKKETADCVAMSLVSIDSVIWAEYTMRIIEVLDSKKIPNYPAWSLHRLMEIVMKGDKLGCITHNIHQNNVSTYYELVISSIEHLIKIDEFNKEYLEEKYYE